MADIKLVIQNENDLYNPFDPSTISDDVISFIKDRTDTSHSGLTLSIISVSSIDTERLKKAFASYVILQRKKLDQERRRNRIQQLRLFLIGITFIACWLFVSSKTEGVWPEVLSIIGSFAVWEAAGIWLIDNPNMRIKKLMIRLLENIEITCSGV